MNANELADEAEMWGRDLLALNMKGGIPVIECAKLVRQLQAEIEVLRNSHIELERGIVKDLNQRQSSEPLAWMQTWDNQDGELKRTVNIEQIGKQDIPLYTNPVKELTGILATIKCIADDISDHKDYENTYSDGWIDACNTVYDEVFAILRKAQEK